MFHEFEGEKEFMKRPKEYKVNVGDDEEDAEEVIFY